MRRGRGSEGGSNLIDLDYDEITKETDKAVQVAIGGKFYWLPKSQIELDRDGRQVILPEWLAYEKEMI